MCVFSNVYILDWEISRLLRYFQIWNCRNSANSADLIDKFSPRCMTFGWTWLKSGTWKINFPKFYLDQYDIFLIIRFSFPQPHYCSRVPSTNISIFKYIFVKCILKGRKGKLSRNNTFLCVQVQYFTSKSFNIHLLTWFFFSF